LLKYGDREYIATIKGVDENYDDVSGIDSAMFEGEFILNDSQGRSFAIPGMGVAQSLGMRINFVTQLNIIIPRRTAGSELQP
jgi:lipoprotein-releasing system permease protein